MLISYHYAILTNTMTFHSNNSKKRQMQDEIPNKDFFE